MAWPAWPLLRLRTCEFSWCMFLASPAWMYTPLTAVRLELRIWSKCDDPLSAHYCLIMLGNSSTGTYTGPYKSQPQEAWGGDCSPGAHYSENACLHQMETIWPSEFTVTSWSHCIFSCRFKGLGFSGGGGIGTLIHLSHFLKINFSLRQIFYFIFLAMPTACGILVPHLGIEPSPSAVKVPSPDYWTAREFLR